MRRAAVLHMKREGLPLKEGARLLKISAGTLRGWKRRWIKGTLGPNMLGRPRYECSSEEVLMIRVLAKVVGHKVSVRYLRERMWWMPRVVMEREVRAYKRQCRRERRNGLEKLDWLGAGRGWVLDWTEPEAPVDGVFDTILVVRDLGSSKQLLSLPVEAKSGHAAAQAMEGLCKVHNPPLFVKTDGGGEFREKGFCAILSRHGVVKLVSPPYYPPYNGAIEAGIGSLKTHAWHHAAAEGRVGHLTCDDVEAGRLIANETSRPWGPKGPSPNEVWKARTPISDAERDEFLKLLEANRPPCDNPDARTKRKIKSDERHAIERTLVAGGYLVVAGRENPIGVF